MKVLYIGSLKSNIQGKNDCLYVPANLILFDEVENISQSGFFALMFIHLDSWNEMNVTSAAKFLFEPEHVVVQLAKSLQESLKYYQKTAKKKNKLVEEMRFISIFKKNYTMLKLEIKRKLEWLIEASYIKPLIGFIEDKTWQSCSYDFTVLEVKESPYIREIAFSLIERKHILALDFCMEEHFSFSPISLINSDEAFPDFIKIPMWKLPLLKNMTHQQLKYTRQDLQPKLLDFQKQLNELYEDLVNINYSSDNFDQIVQLCNQKLSHHIEPTQKTIDASLYISQHKNMNPADHGLYFNIGITSAATIVNYFEKGNIIEPYVATEIKQQVKRYMDLNSTFMFVYYTVNPPIPKD